MGGFDFEESLSIHPNVISLKEISFNDIPPRAVPIKGKLRKVFAAIIQIDNTFEYEIFVGEPKKFPGELPWFYLFHPEQHDFHNHVNYYGDICYTTKSDGIFININQPSAIIHQAVDLVVGVLRSSLDRDLSDLYEEFEGYWQSLPGCVSSRCFFSPTPYIDRITALCDPKVKRNFFPHTLYADPIPEQYGYKNRLTSQQSRKAWYLPLKTEMLPPTPDSGLTAKYLCALLDNVSPAHRDKFLNHQEKQKRKSKNKAKRQCDFLIFSQLRPSGTLALFGVAINGFSKAPFSLNSSDADWNLTPLSIQRHYREYILERGGAHPSLQDKTVAIIGCGAVGSRVAEQIALSGVGKLIIMDHDILSEDNIYRHVLGGEYIGYNKAVAMANHLKSRLPYIDVVAHGIKSYMWSQKKEWEEADIIVDATADFTNMREVNRRNVISSNPIPMVYCWLEPCGIGGHSILVDGVSSGCLECLFDCTDRGPFNRCSFLAPYQKVTKDLTGCGGIFTPFSSLDAIKTATLTTELVLEFFLKNKPTSYRYWVGSDDDARKAGLKISEWYQKAVGPNASEVEQGFCQKHCLACGEQN